MKQVITADADPLFRRFVKQALTGLGLETKVAERGSEAWAWIEQATEPFVVLWGWGLADVGCAEMCERLRRLRPSSERYAIATLGPGEGAAVDMALESGADDVLLKPITADVLLARLRLAEIRCSSPGRQVGTPREALREALGSRVGGEVVVRDGDRVGRVFVSSGEIAWVSLSSEPVGFQALLRSVGVTIDDEVAAAVLEESRRLRSHFADVLVQWGYLDEADARECMRALLSAQLRELLSMQDAAAMFLPRARSFGSRMSFPLAEVAAPTLRPRADDERGDPVSAGPLPRDRLARWGELAERAMRIDGALGAAVLDRSTGVAWAVAGESIDGELAWSLAGTLTSLGPTAEDAIAAREGAAFLARAIDRGCALVVAVSLDRTTLGLARSSMARLVRSGSGGREKEGMADIKTSLQRAMKVDGALGAALVDFSSGMCLGTMGNPGFDLELAAAGNTEVVRAKKNIRDKLGLKDKIEDILITLTGQYHLIRMVGTSMFMYLALDRAKSNLALARKELEAIDRQLDVERS